MIPQVPNPKFQIFGSFLTNQIDLTRTNKQTRLVVIGWNIIQNSELRIRETKSRVSNSHKTDMSVIRAQGMR